MKRTLAYLFFFCLLPIAPTILAQPQSYQNNEEILLKSYHSISSHELFDYVKELASEKYEGRLTGTEGYDASARWVASKFKKWGILPLGDENTYFQMFPIPYTLGSRSYYHITRDNIDTITPEIMEDLAQLLFWTVVEIANTESVNFRN